RTPGEIGAGDVDAAIGIAVPHGDAMPPPELTRDRPLVDVVHPLEIRLGPGPRNDLDLSAPHRFDGRFGERLHPYVPLLGDERLDDGLAAIADTYGVAIGVGALEQAA